MKRILVMAALALGAFAASAGAFLPTCSPTGNVQVDASACFNAPLLNDDGAFQPLTATLLALNFNPLSGNTASPGFPSEPWKHVQSFGGDNNGTGTLTFAALAKGWFAVTLKAGNGYNAYLFDGGSTGLSGIDYSISKDLSHANLWTFEQSNFGGPPLPVPEPTTYALMLVGLAAIGFVSLRRKTA